MHKILHTIYEQTNNNSTQKLSNNFIYYGNNKKNTQTHYQKLDQHEMCLAHAIHSIDTNFNVQLNFKNI